MVAWWWAIGRECIDKKLFGCWFSAVVDGEFEWVGHACSGKHTVLFANVTQGREISRVHL